MDQSDHKNQTPACWSYTVFARDIGEAKRLASRKADRTRAHNASASRLADAVCRVLDLAPEPQAVVKVETSGSLDPGDGHLVIRIEYLPEWAIAAAAKAAD